MPNPHPHNAPARRLARDYDELLRLAAQITGTLAPARSADRRLTVARLLEHWLVDVENRLRPTTVRSYREHATTYLKPALGRIRVADLTRNDVDGMISSLRRADRPRSDSTVLGTFNALRVALNWAVDSELISRNPIARMRAPAVADVAIRPPSAAEVEQFLGAAVAHRLVALFTVAARTGLRQGELLGLTWADVDFEEGILHVRGTLDRDTRQRGPTKTSVSAAPVPLIPAASAALRAHRIRQLEERLAAGRRWREPERVFVTREGRALDGRAVTRTLHRIQDRHGLRRFRFHDLRHALATGMLAVGASPYDVMVAVRHSRIGTTVDQYGHRTPEHLARIRSLMDEAAAVR